MKKFAHIGLSCVPNSHSLEMRQVFNVGEWQAEDLPVQTPNLNEAIIKFANEYKPDLVFIQVQDRGIQKEAIQALKNNGAFIINWSGDLRSRTPDCYFEYAQMGVDLTCFSNMVDIENLRKCGYQSDWLQIGASEAIYDRSGPANHLADIVFFGNTFGHFPLSGLRREMVKEIKRVFGDNFKAFGSGQPDGGQFMSDQNGEASIYRGAKIGINLSHFDSPRYTSDRMMRMALSGICILTHNYQDIEQDFQDKENVMVWDNIGSLIVQIQFLQRNESFRQRIANNGYELGIKEYTFKKMAENILELYNKYKPQ